MTFRIITRGAPRPVRKDFICDVHGKFTALVDSDTDETRCPAPYCALWSPWSPSVIPMRMRRAQATTGKSDKPEHANWDFQANLEEGQDPDEWQADRDAAAERRREQFVVDAVRED